MNALVETIEFKDIRDKVQLYIRIKTEKGLVLINVGAKTFENTKQLFTDKTKKNA